MQANKSKQEWQAVQKTKLKKKKNSHGNEFNKKLTEFESKITYTKMKCNDQV